MSDLIVVENTYPIPLAPGERVEWRRHRAGWSLYRPGDGPFAKALFATPDVGRDGLTAAGREPAMIGLVGECKSKGWRLVLGKGGGG